jgi:hypothetical protein
MNKDYRKKLAREVSFRRLLTTSLCLPRKALVKCRLCTCLYFLGMCRNLKRPTTTEHLSFPTSAKRSRKNKRKHIRYILKKRKPVLTRVASKQTKIISVRTETNRNKICFGYVSVCFVKTKTKNFGLLRFVSVFRTYIETIETNETVSKQTETSPKFLKNTKIYSRSNCFGWSSVRFNRNIKTLCFGLEPKQTVLKQTKTNQNKPKQIETTLIFLNKRKNLLYITLFQLLCCLFCFNRNNNRNN